MDNREYATGAAGKAPTPTVRSAAKSALLRTAVIAVTVTGLGLTPAVAGAGERTDQAVPSAQEADNGIQTGYPTHAACEADRLVFNHYGLNTYPCMTGWSDENAPSPVWYFRWWR